MTTGELTASGDEFVVRIPDTAEREEVLEKVRALGSVEALVPTPDLFLLRLGPATTKKRSARTVWRRIQKLVGHSAEVSPVLRDQDDLARYPVGTIMVRFKKEPSPEEIARLTAEYDLDVKKQNRFVKTQVAFVPRGEAAKYLPDLLDELGQQKDLVAVWPETLSAYQR